MSEKVGRLREYPRWHHGADPELFLSEKGKIIGAERILPKEGLNGASPGCGQTSKVVLDGIQVELHLKPAACRAQFGTYLASSFKTLKAHLKEHHKKSTLSFQGVVEVPEEELQALSESSRVLGCAPSENIHGKPSVELSTINATEYRTRSAGGHLHIGLPWQTPPKYKEKFFLWDEFTKTYPGTFTKEYFQRVYPLGWPCGMETDKAGNVIVVKPGILDRTNYSSARVVPLMDILVGNTCVLLDRDPAQQERRKLYGRAGEYRENAHGLEYRTLSNFWLRSYPLTSFVLGLTRLVSAVIYANGTFDTRFEKELLESVDLNEIQRAINENNALLARKNWQKVKQFIRKNVDSEACKNADYVLPLGPNTLEDFEFFLKKPIQEWFPEDPLTHWTAEKGPGGLPTSGNGWEGFLFNVVREERNRSEKESKDVH